METSAQEPHTQKKSHKVRNIIFIVLGCVIILIIASVVSSAQESAKVAELARVEQARLSADPLTVSSVYNALNKERATTGASALASLSNLTNAADQYCQDMTASNYFDYKNPVSEKNSNSFITDNVGDLYFKHYVTSIFTASTSTETATDAVSRAITTQATNLNNPTLNSVGWSICQSPNDSNQKYIVGAFAEKADKPVAPTRVYTPVASPSLYSSPTNCTTTYNNGFGTSPTATTRCY